MSITTRFASVLTMAIVLAATASGQVTATQTKSPAAQLEAARQQELIEGDLVAAIRQYRAIVDRYAKTDRRVAAQALLGMAACYEKQGSALARASFERVVREFTDQKDLAAIARSRLAGPVTRRATDMRDSRVWAGPDAQPDGSVSLDGRFLTFTDWRTGDLAIRDLTTGTNTPLTAIGSNPASDYAEMSVFSRDGSKVVFSWFDRKAGRYQLRVATTAEPPQPVTMLYDNPEVRWLGATDWSADGRWIAVAMLRVDRTAVIGLVSSADGMFRQLKTTNWRGPTRMQFSPDSRFVAFDVADDDGHQRDIFVLAVDGLREAPVVVHPADDRVVGWTPDGRSLLFSSDRSGALDLWSAPMANGQPAGRAAVVKPDLGHMDALTLTDAGTLYYAKSVSARNVYVADIDPATGRVLTPAREALESYRNNEQPDWSRDGSTLMFVSDRSRPRALTFISTDGRERREVLPKMSTFGRPRFAPDGSITVQGSDLKGRAGIFRVDARTGEATPLAVGEAESSPLQPSWTPDGRYLVYRVAGRAGEARLVAHDIASGERRELARHRSITAVTVSPDGQLVSFATVDQESKTSTINVVPIRGGEPRVIYSIERPTMLLNFSEWTPDGRRLLFATSQPSSTAPVPTLWSVALSGGAPVKIDLAVEQVAGFMSPRLHPDGRRLAFVRGQPAYEIWALENFLPKTGGER